MSEVKFVDGIRAFKPHERAPDFVKGNLVINKAELQEWLNKQGDEIRVDLKEAKSGSYYLSVNDYKPKGGGGPSPSPDDDFDSEIPLLRRV